MEARPARAEHTGAGAGSTGRPTRFDRGRWRCPRDGCTTSTRGRRADGASLFVHGTPTWSFEFRHLIGALRAHAPLRRARSPGLRALGAARRRRLHARGARRAAARVRRAAGAAALHAGRARLRRADRAAARARRLGARSRGSSCSTAGCGASPTIAEMTRRARMVSGGSAASSTGASTPRCASSRRAPTAIAAS